EETMQGPLWIEVAKEAPDIFCERTRSCFGTSRSGASLRCRARMTPSPPASSLSKPLADRSHLLRSVGATVDGKSKGSSSFRRRLLRTVQGDVPRKHRRVNATRSRPGFSKLDHCRTLRRTPPTADYSNSTLKADREISTPRW